MASPPQLREVISSATGIPMATVVDIDRKLVIAKLRTKGGRGLYPAQMTPLDAARLLTALLASPQANAAAEAVQRYARTEVDSSRSSAEMSATADRNDLAMLATQHSFVDALAALIASFSTGSFAKLTYQSDGKSIPRIEVFAFTRATRGRIRISGLPDGLTTGIEYRPAQLGPKPRLAKKNDAEDIGDLEQSRRITERTILPIAALLAQESRNER